MQRKKGLKATTIAKLLNVEGIKDILEELTDRMPDIEELVMIYTRNDGEDVTFKWNAMKDSRICYLCQMLIHHMMERTEDD